MAKNTGGREGGAGARAVPAVLSFVVVALFACSLFAYFMATIYLREMPVTLIILLDGAVRLVS
jgi:hypothetical protein